jgi:hypothetical protein
LCLGDEVRELVLASAELLFELAKHLLLLLDLLEAQVGFELGPCRMQVELRRPVEDGGLRVDGISVSSRTWTAHWLVAGASAGGDSLFELGHPGDNSPHRIDLTGKLSLELLGVRVQALLAA